MTEHKSTDKLQSNLDVILKQPQEPTDNQYER